VQNTAISRRLSSTIDSLRSDFSAFTSALSAVAVRKAHLAPVFMKAFEAWRRETGRPFVAFVQQLDPSIPAEKAEYVQHRSFQAALYLRRLVEAPQTVAGAGRKSVMSPLQALAVVVKSTIAEEHHDFAISALKQATGWHKRDVERLRASIGKARRIALLPHQPRLVGRESRGSSHARVIPRAADRSSSSSSHVH
jgi:hypothetical protein